MDKINYILNNLYYIYFKSDKLVYCAMIPIKIFFMHKNCNSKKFNKSETFLLLTIQKTMSLFIDVLYLKISLYK